MKKSKKQIMTPDHSSMSKHANVNMYVGIYPKVLELSQMSLCSCTSEGSYHLSLITYDLLLV